MTLEKRGKNRWRITIMHKGEIHRTTFEGNKTEAKKANDEFAVLVRKGLAIGNGMNLNSFVEVFRENKYPYLAPKTIVDYDRQINKRILPALGKYKLDEIGVAELKRYYRQLAEDGVGDRTVKKNHQILSSMYTEAMFLGYVAANPCKRLPAPKYRRARNDNFLTAAEANDLMAALGKEKLHWTMPAYIALFTGARIGEVCALTWDNIDLDNREIAITKTRQRVAGLGMIEKEPKTEGSYRTIPFSKALERRLRLWRTKQNQNRLKLGQKYRVTNYVVTYESGIPIEPQACGMWFREFIERNHLKKVTLHGLRHTYATLLLHSGRMPDYAISGNLGHSDPTTHKRIYTHEIQESNRIAADYLDEIISK